MTCGMIHLSAGVSGPYLAAMMQPAITETPMSTVAIDHSPDGQERRLEYLHYLLRQRRPMVHALLMTASLAYTGAVVIGTFIRPLALPLWLRLIPVPLMLLVTMASRRVRKPWQLSALALACVLLLEVGINLNNISPQHQSDGILPGLLLPVASSVIWLGRTDFLIAMLLSALGPLPMLFSGSVDRVQAVQYLIFMAIAIAMSAVLRTFMERTLFSQFKLEQQLRERAYTDDLTGLLVRNRFLELAQRALDDIRQQQRPACMLYLDADNFKQLNDDHGHAAGDAALIALAATMRSQLRQDDLLGRIGGEEFALLLPGVDLRRASERAEHLRLAVRSIQRPDGPLTVSIGVVESGPTAETVDVLLARADQAMRHAKRDGRDRIVHDCLAS